MINPKFRLFVLSSDTDYALMLQGVEHKEWTDLYVNALGWYLAKKFSLWTKDPPARRSFYKDVVFSPMTVLRVPNP